MTTALPGDKTSSAKFPALALYLVYAAVVLAARLNPFFWDSILLASRYGQWYFDTDFKSLFVPQNIAGYPPVFGMLVASSWKILGKSLVASHLLILPFALGIVYQVLKLCRKFIPPNKQIWAALLLLADPTLLAQITQVAPDVLLVFLYLFFINQLLQNKRLAFAFALIFLGMLSPRGTIAVGLLFFTDVALALFSRETSTSKSWLTLLFSYVPAGLVVAIWQLAHYFHFGWVGYNPESSWGAYTQFAGIGGMARNAFLIGWRMMDFGRLAWWLVGAIIVFIFLRKKEDLPAKTRILFILFLIPFLGFSLVFLPYTNPIGHRYYLVPILLFGLLICCLLFNLKSKVLQWSAYIFILANLVLGNFWVYPDSIAKGWDATLAHLPYFELRKEAISYLEQQQIPRYNVGSEYPNLAPLSQTDLLPDTIRFKPTDLQTDNYVLYSNIFNGFSDTELQELKTTWKPVKTWKKGQVYMVLYQRPGTLEKR
jgi:hypothetical protein